MNYFKYMLENAYVVKNLLIINVLAFFATMLLDARFGLDITEYGAVYYFDSSRYMPWQMFTSPFLHGNFPHLFYNMFALFMFGCIIERAMDSKKFLLYYMACAIGAIFVQWVADAIMIQTLNISAADIETVKTEGVGLIQRGLNYSDAYLPDLSRLNLIYNVGMVGASGAIYGVLLAFGMIFPNRPIYLYFIMPIKAKWLVLGYGAIELFSGLSNNMYDNVAHFAHLGGMFFGLLILLYWHKTGKIYFYND